MCPFSRDRATFAWPKEWRGTRWRKYKKWAFVPQRRWREFPLQQEQTLKNYTTFVCKGIAGAEHVHLFGTLLLPSITVCNSSHNRALTPNQDMQWWGGVHFDVPMAIVFPNIQEKF